jgi:hypothetical protein
MNEEYKNQTTKASDTHGPSRTKSNHMSLHMTNKADLHEIKTPKTPTAKSRVKKEEHSVTEVKSTRAAKTDVINIQIIYRD